MNRNEAAISGLFLWSYADVRVDLEFGPRLRDRDSTARSEPILMRSGMLVCAASLPAASRVCRQASDVAKSAQPQIQPPPPW